MADLITLSEYKEYAGIKSTEQDSKIEQLIPAVSSFVKRYCHRDFIDYYNTNKTEYFGQAYDLIYLKESPIKVGTAGPELTVYTKAYPTDTYTAAVSDVDYCYDFELEAVRCISADGFPDFPNSVKIVYKGGFLQTPEDLKLGILDLITYYMKGESSPRKSLNSNQISVEYVTSSDLPAHIKRVFDLYRNII